MNDRPRAGIVCMPREMLHLLLELTGQADMETLRAAGDAGGPALLHAFSHWLADGGTDDVADLPVEVFRQRAAEFFQWCGWGATSLSTGTNSLIEVSISDSWEARRDQSPESGCHVTTGLLHGFFAALAGYEVGVMEIECAGLGSGETCRFVIGTPEMVDSIYAGLSAGSAYEEIVGSAG
ncbi:MAG: V4R domain-containing protein [Gemmatimonadaceae bacterium]